MEHLSTTDLHNNLKSILDRVNADRQPISIGRGGGKEIVLLDGEDYRSIMETLYLLQDPANAQHLKLGMRQHQDGQRLTIDVATYLD
ncbi:type II toxin-antitoxin system Phd/YefM family antitoxin [uncultured Thiodictyon sp.]|uniref:type II toxin-antitoxin system Phd/YefM family antitoxin n=1 Tax=uncultured Thiodictyon sp. TaxID=1846217 RepID=UPI0025EF3F5A|nr:type II toxin-antitoxin system Phd/YefM family antitoxin [uncultured Thiodictyon sp.]